MSSETLGPVGQRIQRKLMQGLSPSHLSVIDDSDSHRGHAGHDGRGESHFHVEIVADAFVGQSRVARQRMVYGLLAEELADRVHALSISAKAPEEGA